MHDLIIVGGGPAGVAAGIYAARQKLNTLLVTKDFGGQVARKATAIENYPGFVSISGSELFQKFEEHLRLQEMEIKKDKVVKIEKSGDSFKIFCENKEELSARAVIVASGADPRPLEVEGEKEFIGRGVSYCTVCDGPLFGKKTVAVIGGGDAGFEAAIFLSKISPKIYILEYGTQIKASPQNQGLAQKTGRVEVIPSAALKKIQGKQFVESIIYEDKNSGEEKTLQVQGVFVEIGSSPATAFVRDLVDFDERDEIKINFETCQTKTPGLFAAGDVTEVKEKQIVVAAGQGTTAALRAYQYLNKI